MDSSSGTYNFVPQHLGPQQQHKTKNKIIANYILIFTGLSTM
jgi:hypothetical protein